MGTWEIAERATPWSWPAVRVAGTIGVAGVVTVVLRSCGANLAPAVLAYLVVVVTASWLGRAEATGAVVASYLMLNVWFTAPVGSLEVTKSEDIAPLIAFSITAIVCVRGRARDPGPLVAVGAVAAASALLLVADADAVVASTAFTGVVVAAALLGTPAAAVAVVSSYVALNFWFTPPFESLEINSFEDLAPLVAFAVVATVSAGTVSRINWLRRRQAEIEHEVFDARVSSAVNESRAAFLSSMTHNLRTPLATIKATIAALSASSVIRAGSDEAGLLETAHDETDRLERLVTKVLELSRIHAGALQPIAEPTDVAELARVAAHRVRQVASRREVSLSIDAEFLIVTVDPSMIELVFVILLENAVRYAPEGSEILVRAEATEGDRCEVRVIDHGPGIAAQDRERVFDEFVRLDAREQGSGLGLAIARALVEAHDGTIWVEQTPRGGATVAFSLPDAEIA